MIKEKADREEGENTVWCMPEQHNLEMVTNVANPSQWRELLI